MGTTHFQRRLAVGITLAALPVIAISAAPIGLADECDWDPSSFDCVVNSDDFSGSSGFSDRGFQFPSLLATPVTGGPPEVALIPALPGGFAILPGGGFGIPFG